MGLKLRNCFNKKKKNTNCTDNISKIENTNNIINLPSESVIFSKKVLDDFRKTVGRYPAETGGMIACSKDIKYVDTWCFDKKSRNTAASYSYDVEQMSIAYREWKKQNTKCVGFVHSHPASYRQPSYDDIATAYELMKFFKNDFFYLPIIMSDRKGLFTLFSFVIRKKENKINVNLDYVLKAKKEAYEYVEHKIFNKSYTTDELEEYYNRVNKVNSYPAYYQRNTAATKSTFNNELDNRKYFQRIEGTYPENVLDKVIVCVGDGGARTIIENLARNGFRNYVLIDGDKIAPSNVATQGVFISEMGMYKTEAIKNRVKDINPDARVLCVNRFLDDTFSDEEFKSCLDMFKGKKPTDYLIMGCTDSFECNKRCALLSLKYGIPYLGAGVYIQGLAAEVIFVYPGVTESCPRCLLRNRYEAYENGYKNDVTSSGCPTFATERINTLIGYISLIMLMYNEAPGSPYNKMLDEIKNRNFVWVRLTPYLSSSQLGITLFDRVFSDSNVSKYTFMDETLWIPQTADDDCKLCEGVGDLRKLKNKWKDTRTTDSMPYIKE